MTTGNPAIPTAPDAYSTQSAVNESSTPGLFETTIVVSQQQLDIGAGQLANLEVYNGTAPGPTLFLDQDDDVVVRMINQLPHPSGIHWHGIELPNGADGTPVTQNGLAPAVVQNLGDGTPSGGTYLYKFSVPRPGLYWYHPHHYHSTNRVFRQSVGMIVVAHPAEAGLVSTGVLPPAANTYQLVLTDITVCKAPGSNDAATYDPALPWAGPGGVLPPQPSPTPLVMCETQPVDEEGADLVDAMGDPIPFAEFDVPNLQRPQRVNEGQTVLTNGVNVGHRPGTPDAPDPVDPAAQKIAIAPGEGLRLQIVNAATTRYFRLLLKVFDGTAVVTVPLIRVGGEGGLLDFARIEGDLVGMPGFHKYEAGEIVLPPASRADVVAVIPVGASGEATLWTLDYRRTGSGGAMNWANLPTVPVMHLDISGPAGNYALADGGPILDAAGAAVPVLPDPAPSAGFLPPPAGKPGNPNLTIRLQNLSGPQVDSVTGDFSSPPIYTGVPNLGSTRWAPSDGTIMLTVVNESAAHHPFHLHGFSFQPVALTHPSDPDFTWTYNEFRDNLDIPPGYTLTAKVHFDERPWHDGVIMGGNFGRWLFHCHIFHHAHKGMIAELVVTSPDGSQKPDVSVHGSWAYAPIPGIATRDGRFSHPDGNPVTLSAHLADGTLIGTVTTAGDTWEWEYDTSTGGAVTDYVYITATDGTRAGQTVFRLQAGGDPMTAWDTGDPHIHTLDGQRYDFQAAGEFVLLTDDHGLEIQARQTPVPTQNPIADDYAGFAVCVAVNTAIAARVGDSWVSYQPGQEAGDLVFHLNGKPADPPVRAVRLKGGHRVSTFDADSATGLRIDWAHGAVLQVTPRFWAPHGVWYMNVSVSDVIGRGGLMAPIAPGSWLPPLPSGLPLGPRPRDPGERYRQLYRGFGDAWRVTDASSLFAYAPGTSTATFTDADWPGEGLPCNATPTGGIPRLAPLAGMDLADAEQACAFLTDDGLRKDCVFDVAVTGDTDFAAGYRVLEALAERSVGVTVKVEETEVGGVKATRLVALVRQLSSGTPTGGGVTFLDGDTAISPDIPLDPDGRAGWTVTGDISGSRDITAIYDGGTGADAAASPPVAVDVTPAPDTPASDTPRPSWRRWLWLWVLLALVLLLLLLI